MVRWSSTALMRNADDKEGCSLVTTQSREVVVRLLLGEVTHDHLLGKWSRGAVRTKRGLTETWLDEEEAEAMVLLMRSQ